MPYYGGRSLSHRRQALSSAPNAVEKNAPCTFTGWRASCNKLIILTKKKDFEDVAGRRGVEPLC